MREESSRRNVYDDLNINHKGRKDREAAIRLALHKMLAENGIDRRRRMSDKPRRDITLGEMQDECNARGCDCTTAELLWKDGDSHD